MYQSSLDANSGFLEFLVFPRRVPSQQHSEESKIEHNPSLWEVYCVSSSSLLQESYGESDVDRQYLSVEANAAEVVAKPSKEIEKLEGLKCSKPHLSLPLMGPREVSTS